MSGLSPERLDALTRMLREWHPIGPRWVAVGIAPLVADMLAAEREAGAAEVRARVEAAVDRRCLRLQHTGGNGICLPCHGLGAALLADLNGGE